jgi:D-3-phosphoglycerate dehydrogenase
MDVLIVEPLDCEALQWLQGRRRVVYAPQFAADGRSFREALSSARATVIPASVPLLEDAIVSAPLLRAVGRVSAGAENIDTDACARAGIEVVRPLTASAVAEAEFTIGALLQLLRRVPIINAEGLLVGRELGGTTIGLVGMAPAAPPLAKLLGAFGARVVGYDPAVHASDPLWARWQVRPLPLTDLFEACDGVCVLLTYFSRYRGLLGERFLAVAKPNQVVVCLAQSSVFDDAALADALLRGRLSAAWFDSVEPGMLDPGRPLRQAETLQVTPRVAATTLESRSRSAWAVVRRIDEILGPPASAAPLRPAPTGDLADLADGPAPG